GVQERRRLPDSTAARTTIRLTGSTMPGNGNSCTHRGRHDQGSVVRERTRSALARFSFPTLLSSRSSCYHQHLFTPKCHRETPPRQAAGPSFHCAVPQRGVAPCSFPAREKRLVLNIRSHSPG